MARKARIASETGVYHVMMRGVNRQDIFESDKDYIKFLKCLRKVAHPVDGQGQSTDPLIIIYAYCLMPNHVHLLVRQVGDGISDAIKSVSVAYALYFNKKYDHLGHLFQDRFRSETVNNLEYFVTLLRYIHQNPVAGGLVRKVKSYRWSSWVEFDGSLTADLPVCNVDVVFKMISFDALEELVNEPLPKTQRILDFDNDTSVRLTDDMVRSFIHENCGIDEVAGIQQLDKADRNAILLELVRFGASISQISRITGVSRGVIQRLLQRS